MKRNLTVSFTDRLIGDIMVPLINPASLSHENYELSECVRTDLESLLNTKRYNASWGKAYNYIEQSVINYGIDDFMGIFFDSVLTCEVVCIEIERAISLFESRLHNVKVVLDPSYISDKRSIAFHIDALLYNGREYEMIKYHSMTIHPTRTFTVTTVNRGSTSGVRRSTSIL